MGVSEKRLQQEDEGGSWSQQQQQQREKVFPGDEREKRNPDKRSSHARTLARSDDTK